MKRFHIALSTANIQASVEDYTRRLDCRPTLVIENEYALWRTETLNVSIRKDSSVAPGSLRHLGWEDSRASEFSAEKDCNGILWERFAKEHQNAEILEIWPEAEIAGD